MNAGVIVAYNGVHQAYQIALAAHELGRLDQFLCSFFDGNGCWGRVASKLFGPELLRNYRCPGIDAGKVTDFPWPTLLHYAKSRMYLSRDPAWIAANRSFDRWASEQLDRNHVRVFVGTETCALHCFKAAQARGMLKVLDAPQLHPRFVEGILARAGKDCGIEVPGPLDPPELARRKQKEFDVADCILVYSNVHKRSFVEAGYKNFFQCPLWVDTEFWFRESNQKGKSEERGEFLRALFVGSINMRKGIPYLLNAVRRCSRSVSLSTVGPVSSALKPLLRTEAALVRLLPPASKSSLRKVYSEHDVLVLPSLADSFGFVALEAMACGLPVIISENCGAPVPDEAWRVPVMNSDAIANRLAYYADDREALARDSVVAIAFAKQFTPARYRGEIKNFLRRVLEG